MGDQTMSSPKITLLLVWCGLLSVSLVVISVMQLPARQNTQAPGKDNNVQENEPKPQPTPASFTADRPLSHIHLTILDSDLTLKEELPLRFANTSRSLVLRNNSVYVHTAGFYHFYAQVTFGKVPHLAWRVVTLISNPIPGMQAERILSEAVGWGNLEGSISISQTISCRSGQNLRLEIQPRSPFRYNTQQTYWGLFLLNP